MILEMLFRKVYTIILHELVIQLNKTMFTQNFIRLNLDRQYSKTVVSVLWFHLILIIFSAFKLFCLLLFLRKPYKCRLANFNIS